MLEKLKNNAISILALLCAAASLFLSVTARTDAPESADYTQQIEALEEQNAQLRFQLDALELRLEDATYVLGLSDWNLEAVVWDDNTGADAVFTAHPESYREGDTAAFMVYLNGELAANLTCSWDGSAYSATAQLPAANGYSFVCVLDGEQFPLASPESPLVPELVYLADSLNAYCTLMLSAWEATDQTLELQDVNAGVHLPQLTAGTTEPVVETADLVLYINDAQVDSHTLTMVPGEGSGSYVIDSLDLTFGLDSLTDGDLVELWMEVSLSGSEVLRTCGGSWNCENGQLQLTAG